MRTTSQQGLVDASRYATANWRQYLAILRKGERRELCPRGRDPSSGVQLLIGAFSNVRNGENGEKKNLNKAKGSIGRHHLFFNQTCFAFLLPGLNVVGREADRGI